MLCSWSLDILTPSVRRSIIFWHPLDVSVGLDACAHAHATHGQHMISTWPAHGQHMVSTWSAHGQHMVSTCTDLCVGEPVERKVKSSMHVRRASRFECLYPCQEAVFVGFNHRHKRWCVRCRIAGLNSVSHTVCAQRASTLLSEIVACDCQLSHGEKTMVV